MTAIPAEQSLREGHLDEALVQLQNQVRSYPVDAKYRIFLFQLLAVMGRWKRAMAQLEVCGTLDSANLSMVQAYREAIRCELLRHKVFQGQTSPLIFGEPESWIAYLIESLKLDALDDREGANRLRQDAFESAPTTSGRINGQSFSWIADADGRLGPVLEAIVNGHYYWIPFSRIAEISVDPPVDLRDMVWLPARFVWANGGDAVGLIPARYPSTDASNDSSLQLGRKTDWIETVPGHYRGLGQRILSIGDEDFPLLEIREIALNTK